MVARRALAIPHSISLYAKRYKKGCLDNYLVPFAPFLEKMSSLYKITVERIQLASLAGKSMIFFSDTGETTSNPIFTPHRPYVAEELSETTASFR